MEFKATDADGKKFTITIVEDIAPVVPPAPAPPPVPAVPSLIKQGLVPVNPVTSRIVGKGKTYDVGPGQSMLDPDNVPWDSLGPGDVVNVHPGTNLRKFALRGQGTKDNPIVINGVTDAQGNRPVFNFNGAHTCPQTKAIFTGHQPQYGESLGGILIMRGSADDYATYAPAWIEIRNLEVYGASKGTTYTALDGSTQTYGSAAGIYLHSGSDILIENCVVHNNAFGVFMMAKDDTIIHACQRVTLRSCRIYDNGVSGSYLEHNCYIQGDSPLIEGCYIGKTIAGSQGSSFKDRSARLIFRDNYVVGSARCLDLVESDEQAHGIAALPYYGTDYVYRNTLIYDGASSAPLHYGGDNLGEQGSSGPTPTVFVPSAPYRSHLYFWGNTVLYNAAQWRAHLFSLSTTKTVCDAWQNTFNLQGASHFHWLYQSGVLNLGQNAVVGAMDTDATDGALAGQWSVNRNAPVPNDPFLANLL